MMAVSSSLSCCGEEYGGNGFRLVKSTKEWIPWVYNIIGAQVVLDVAMLGQFQHQINVVRVLEEAEQLQDGRMTEASMDGGLLLDAIRHPVDLH